jgi:RNA polymerase sigma-70 factor, ECF subfamily
MDLLMNWTATLDWLWGWRLLAAPIPTGDPVEAPLEGSPESIWMARLAAGDSSALRPIFDRWKLPLVSYFYRALGSRWDAEDLALQTFERVYRAAGRYRPEAPFSSWLFAIARREMLHEMRRRRRKPVEAVDPADLAWNGSAEDPAATVASETAEAEEHLLVALQELPERQRSALLLVAAGDLTREEIAAALNLRLGHLNVLVHRARSALREALQRIQ